MTGPGTIPADAADAPCAGALSGKSTKPQTIREFERALLTLGFSKSEAKAVASGGFKAKPHPEQLVEQLDALANAIAGYQSFLKETP
jgi:hypothetical protein